LIMSAFHLTFRQTMTVNIHINYRVFRGPTPIDGAHLALLILTEGPGSEADRCDLHDIFPL